MRTAEAVSASGGLLARLHPPMLWGTLVTGLLAITMGGVVRATGSGLGCPDWPLCHGRVIPPPDLGAWLEYLHRLSGAGVVVFTVGMVLTGLAYRPLRGRPRWPLLVPLGLLGVQVGLGGLTVLWELPPMVVLAHLGVAMAFVGAVALLLVPETRWKRVSPAEKGYQWLGLLLGVGGFILLMSGALVTRTGSALMCASWPLCGPPLPHLGHLQAIQMAHRYTALAMGLVLVAGLVATARLRPPAGRALWTLAGLSLLFFALQVALGAVNVLLRLPLWAQAGHVGAAGAFYGAVMLWAGLAWTPPWAGEE